MTSEMKFTSYRAFWLYYVNEHRNPKNRRLHFFGTAFCLLLLFLAGATEDFWFLAAVPFVGYGFAWAGHYFFEKNHPATFRYPFWSLAAELQMFALMCMGRMNREVRRMDVLAGF